MRESAPRPAANGETAFRAVGSNSFESHWRKPSIQLAHRLHHCRLGEPLVEAAVGRGTEPRTQLRVIRQGRDCTRRRIEVADWDQKALDAVAHHLAAADRVTG